MIEGYMIIQKKDDAFQKWSMVYTGAIYTSYEVADKELDALVDRMNAIIGGEAFKKSDYEVIKIAIEGGANNE